MKMPLRPGLWLFGAVLLVLFAGCATSPSEYREPAVLSPADRSRHNLEVYERVWSLVNKKYFDAHFRGVDWPAMKIKHQPEAVAAKDETDLYETLNRLCVELKESHLSALPPRRAHEFDTAHRASVGFRWQMLEGYRIVTDVVPASPAAMAGVETGWLVVSRNGLPISEKDIYRPRLNEPVTYGFRNNQGEDQSLTMSPQLLNFDQLKVSELPDGLVYLRFDVFSRQSLSWLSEQLKAHSTAPGVVIDLRNNSGGNVLALNVAVAEFFQKKVPLGRTIKRSGRERESESLSWLSARYSGRVVILTDHTTASAAEIFSHVLQKHQRATVVGRTTAGAVIVSRFYALPGSGKLQIPESDYVGLDGLRLEGRGVTPDVPIPKPTLAQLRSKQDPDLAAAVEQLQQPEQGLIGTK